MELPTSGRALSQVEKSELQQMADATFRDVRMRIEGLPKELHLIVRWGKDVIPETGESGAAAFPGNVALTLDPDRDVLAIIRTHVRPALVHELHHLARESRVHTVSFRDRVISEGLATAFERDVAGVKPLWGEPPTDASWASEILALPDDADTTSWLIQHPDGRRWIGMRVGTALVDCASRRSGKSPAELVFTPSEEIVRLAKLGGDHAGRK